MAATLTIAKLTVGELRSNEDLLREHSDECEAEHNRALDVQWTTYEKLDAKGWLSIFGVWATDDDGHTALRGYVAGVYMPAHLHHAGWSLVTVTALYVHPSIRRADVTADLMDSLRNESRRLGANSIVWHAKVKSAFDFYLCRKTDFELIEHIYEEKLR